MALGGRFTRRIMEYARSIGAAARSKLSVFNVVSRTEQAMAAQNIPVPSDMTAIIDTGLAWANSLEDASASLMSADQSAMIDASMVSTRYPTINLQVFNAAPAYRAKVTYTVQGDPTEYGLWVHNINPFGMTVGEMKAAMRLNLEGMVNDTGPNAGQNSAINEMTGIQLVMDAPPAL